jgi:hypothetical protein
MNDSSVTSSIDELWADQRVRDDLLKFVGRDILYRVEADQREVPLLGTRHKPSVGYVDDKTIELIYDPDTFRNEEMVIRIKVETEIRRTHSMMQVQGDFRR